jgi:hypothetical protein
MHVHFIGIVTLAMWVKLDNLIQDRRHDLSEAITVKREVSDLLGGQEGGRVKGHRMVGHDVSVFL